eukprot:TRINITY_DN3_c0_g1_i4.p1 TRINITY_DN3_c0_g1~~TRINITY_DN3_c0_g1_i4.p1  ORF type:complete len:627 (+),score=171.25 TRINITY_DN3_c0_g1_i4:283-2163(+)
MAELFLSAPLFSEDASTQGSDVPLVDPLGLLEAPMLMNEQEDDFFKMFLSNDPIDESLSSLMGISTPLFNTDPVYAMEGLDMSNVNMAPVFGYLSDKSTPEVSELSSPSNQWTPPSPSLEIPTSPDHPANINNTITQNTTPNNTSTYNINNNKDNNNNTANNAPINIPSPLNPVPSTASLNSSPITELPADYKPKKSRSAKRARPVDLPPPEKFNEGVTLPRDTLLSISSTTMDQLVDQIQSARPLSVDEQKEIKRQKRLIKNRESAQLSRERRRLYIDQLEDKINDLNQEIQQLKSENQHLKTHLLRYEPNYVAPKIEPPSTPPSSSSSSSSSNNKPIVPKPISNLLSVGNSSQSSNAKAAGVCLLIILFAFGLFFNPGATPSASLSRFPLQYKAREPVPEVVPSSHERVTRMIPSIMGPPPSYEGTSARDLLALDDDDFDTNPMDTASTASSSSRDRNLPLPDAYSLPLVVKRAGTYEVSYTPNPRKYLESEEKAHSHTHTRTLKKGSDNTDWMQNSTSYMLYLDPRPEISTSSMGDGDDIQISNKQESEHSTTTHTFVKYAEGGLPPMIISLVLPSEITNGTNPLLPPKDVNPEDSIIELTCKVIDVSLTTRIDRSRQHTHDD